MIGSTAAKLGSQTEHARNAISFSQRKHPEGNNRTFGDDIRFRGEISLIDFGREKAEAVFARR